MFTLTLIDNSNKVFSILTFDSEKEAWRRYISAEMNGHKVVLKRNKTK